MTLIYNLISQIDEDEFFIAAKIKINPFHRIRFSDTGKTPGGVFNLKIHGKMQYINFVSLFVQDGILCFPDINAGKLKNSINRYNGSGNSIITI